MTCSGGSTEAKYRPSAESKDLEIYTVYAGLVECLQRRRYGIYRGILRYANY